ncbi:MAG: FRG domain-containing protein [Candidatus Moraniibacteriota bacterium]
MGNEQRRLVFELFAQGQHHELSTPLLDWSRSPQVALFFAFEELDSRIDDEGCRVVYALNRTIIERRAPPTSVIKENGIMFFESMGHRNPRLIGQSGLFTFSPSHLSIEKWVIDNYINKPDLPILLRFMIRNKARKECLADLDLMNIHSRNLFPDLIGVGRAANYILERY